MLIDIKFSNFRSFFDENVFSMKKGLKRELENKIIKVKAGGEQFSLLPTKAIFGVNASGKTSLVLLFDLLKEIMISGYINNEGEVKNRLSFFFYLHEKEKYSSPMSIDISFIYDNNLYNYILKFKNNNNFDNEPITFDVLYEELKFNNLVIFERNNNVINLNPNDSKKVLELLDSDEHFLNKMEEMLKNNVDSFTVFTKWFNINKNILNGFRSFFDNNLIIFNDIDEVEYNSKILDNNDYNIVRLNKAIINLVKAADFGPQKISFEVIDELSNDNKPILFSHYDLHDEDANILYRLNIPSKNIESLGTIRLIKFLAPYLDAIIGGKVLVIDELDDSLHPEIMAAIIKTFADPEINRKGAQLIFTTHNPVFLNEELLRRDEIMFVEKNNKTFESTIFTLDDFDVRGDQKYLKNYLSQNYITFPDIDLSDIILNLLDEKDI